MKMLGYVIALLTPIAVLSVSGNNSNCEIKTEWYHTELYCSSFDIQATNSETKQSLRNIAVVQFTGALGDIQNNTLQYFPNIYRLSILDSNVTSFTLESDMSSLNVTNSTFPKVTSEILKGCKRLRALVLVSNPGLEFEDSPFKNLRLEDVVIENQSLPRVKKQLFEGMEQLGILMLGWNGIRDIDEDAFTELFNLRTLSLEGNPIESLHVNFSSLTRLYTISLFGTNLKRINLDSFRAATQLQTFVFPLKSYLQLNVTELTQKLPSIKTVIVHEAHLSCPEVLPVLEEIRKTGIKVTELSFSDLPYYKSLKSKC